MRSKAKRVFGPPSLTAVKFNLTNQQVNAIRNISTGTLKDAARQFGVSEGTISDIWHNRGRFRSIPVREKTPPVAETTEG